MIAPLRASLLAAALAQATLAPAAAAPIGDVDPPAAAAPDPAALAAPPPAAPRRQAITLLTLAGVACLVGAALWAVSLEPARERDAASRAFRAAPVGSRDERVAELRFAQANVDADVARIASVSFVGLGLALAGGAIWRW